MPLNNGYGVLIGTKHDYYRDPINDYGQYYHGNLILKAPLGLYHCAIDVDSKSNPDGVEWRVLTLKRESLKGIADLQPGWHSLHSTPNDGSLDYIRNPDFRPRAGCLIPEWLQRRIGIVFVQRPDHEIAWSRGSSIEALADLEYMLANPKRVYVYGEPFRDGLGVHNIHQNQGDLLVVVGGEWHLAERRHHRRKLRRIVHRFLQ